MMTPSRPRAAHGFTLIEVLVALVILSVMAAAAFKGMDSISRAREISESKLKRTLRLQSVMTQWDADMANVMDVPTVSGGNVQGPRTFLFNGSYLRFARQTPTGVQVIAWSLRNDRWERWASPSVMTVGDLDTQWAAAAQLKGNEPGTLTMIKGVEQWQLYYCTSNPTAGTAQPCTWANAQSTASSNALPVVVQSTLTLGPRSGFEGVAMRQTMLAAH